MSNFSLFSFNSGKSSLAHINYDFKEDRYFSGRFCKPEAYNTFDTRFFDSDCKNEKFILRFSEEKRRLEEKHEAGGLLDEKDDAWANTLLPRTCWKCCELVLTLRPNQCDNILARFEEFGYTVKISHMKNKPNSYVVLFPSRKMAEKALAQANIIGYTLVKKRRPRPSPRCPIMFKALSKLKIRSGKAFSRNVLGWVRKNDLVMVNQVKGRRARLLSWENGANLGWVSLHTSNGIQLLEQTDLSLKEVILLVDELNFL